MEFWLDHPMSAASRARDQERRLTAWTTFRARQRERLAQWVSSNEQFPAVNRLGGDACRGWLVQGGLTDAQVDQVSVVTLHGIAAEHRDQQTVLWLAGTPIPANEENPLLTEPPQVC